MMKSAVSKKFVLWLVLFGFSAVASQQTPALKDVEFISQEGKAFHLHDFKGKHLFVSFIFSRCPMEKACPLTITLSKSLLRKWQSVKGAPELHFLFVTLDPEFDTPKALKDLAKSRGLDPRYFTFATGNAKTLEDFASEFNVLGVPSAGTISHNVKSILIGPDMVPIKEFKENEWKAEDVLKSLLPQQKTS